MWLWITYTDNNHCYPEVQIYALISFNEKKNTLGFLILPIEKTEVKNLGKQNF